MKIIILLISLLDIFYLIYSQNRRGTEYSSNDFQNSDVRRTIDLRGNVIHIETTLVIKSLRLDPTFTYRFPLLKNNSLSLVFLKANLKSSDGREEVSGIKINKLIRVTDENFEFYEINFKSEPMNTDEERLLVIQEDYFGRLAMLPKKITLKEDQLVVFQDTQNYISAYTTLDQRTELTLPSDKTDVMSFTTTNGERSREKITYQLNFSVEPMKIIPLRIHYENNKPIGVFNTARKIIEVSHWGNVAIEERYQIENVGAKLDGEFGRVDYDNGGRRGGLNGVKKLRAKLPLRSNGLWYGDEIGNISTSRANRNVSFLFIFIIYI